MSGSRSFKQALRTAGPVCQEQSGSLPLALSVDPDLTARPTGVRSRSRLLDLVRASDAVAVASASALAQPLPLLPGLAVVLVGWTLLAATHGLHAAVERPFACAADQLAGLLHATLLLCAVVLGGLALRGEAAEALGRTALLGSLILVLVPAARGVVRVIARRRGIGRQRILVVGETSAAHEFLERLDARGDERLDVVGVLGGGFRTSTTKAPILGSAGDLARVVDLVDVDRVIIADEPAALHVGERQVRELTQRGVDVDLTLHLGGALSAATELHSAAGTQLLTIRAQRHSRVSLAMKRGVDVAVCVVALPVLAPVLAFIAILVRLDSPGSVLYRNEVIGRGGKPIALLKFRTMKAELCRGERYGGDLAEAAFQQLLSEPEHQRDFTRALKLISDPRVTRAGRHLRRWSLDELPQMLNVLRGDLSLVGPRPVRPDEREAMRSDTLVLEPAGLPNGYWDASLRPGLTGYWQTEGRSHTTYQERIRMDLAYISGWSLRLDLAILLRTVGVLLRRAGAY